MGQRYRDAGLADVTVTLYPAARHEILNEINLTIPNRYPSASVRALTEFLRGHLKPMGYFWAPPHSKREEV